MSRYRFLALSPPTIAYCALHQALPEIPPDQYEATMRDLHGRLRHESRQIAAAYEEFLGDLERKESLALITAVRDFLQTPLQQDRGEILSLLRESLNRFRRHLIDEFTPGSVSSSEGLVLFPEGTQTHTRRALAGGRKYIENTGLSIAKGSGGIYESVFLVQGGENLDLIEHIVRDVLGIYSTTHGKHIREFGRYSYAVHNHMGDFGDGSVESESREWFEVALFFSKPDPDVIKYAPFRQGLSRLLQSMTGDLAIPRASLWQRKLGLGAGLEFVVRCLCKEIGAAGEITGWLSASREPSVARDVLAKEAKMVVKQLLLRQ